MSAVSAEDINSSDDLISDNGSVILSDDVLNDEMGDVKPLEDDVFYLEPSSNKTINISNFECCSFIIQEEYAETIYGFRQDAPLNGFGVEINAQNWYGRDIIKQEIDTYYDYFFHCIITEDGWVIGQGGSQYNDDNTAIERIAGDIVSNNDISPSYLRKARDVLYKYGYGHFVIKAPDGRYGIAFFDSYYTGNLHPGQFMVVSNDIAYYQKGYYRDYASNPVDALISICSYDDSGLNRRNLYTYDYKIHDTPNGVFNGVDVYVTNDNGHNVGLDTSKIVTHFYYKGAYYPPSAVPENPGKLYAGTHLFENTAVGNMIELVEGISNAVIDDETSVKYRIHLLNNEHKVVFDLDENIDFVNAYTTHGSYEYNAQQHTLYWYLPALNEVKEITINFKPKVVGNHYIHTYVEGKSQEHDLSFYAAEYGAYITTNDVDKYVGGPQKLNIYLKDKYGKSLIGETVDILINGMTYHREVNNQGYAALALNLGAGEYGVAVSYSGRIGENQTTAKVTIKPTTFAEDIEKYFKNDTQFYASFLDGNGNPLKNSNVQFNINGVFYTRTTNEKGVAKLNINLHPDNYIITSINSATGEQIANYILVKTVLVEHSDLVKYYRNGSPFTVKVLDGQGKPISGADVIFNINGVFYTRTTNESGVAKLNINLWPGDYIITTQYNGEYASNDIMVLERLITKDLEMHYRDGSKFEAVVLDEHGNIAPGENVTFNINGVFYNRTADEKGSVFLNINLMSGQYIITSYWNDYRKSNIITISLN